MIKQRNSVSTFGGGGGAIYIYMKNLVIINVCMLESYIFFQSSFKIIRLSLTNGFVEMQKFIDLIHNFTH